MTFNIMKIITDAHIRDHNNKIAMNYNGAQHMHHITYAVT